MRNGVPRYIYRGENLGDIEKYGRLTFNYDANHVAKQLTADSTEYTADNTDINGSDTLDFLLLESTHVNGTGHRQTQGYLSFTTSVKRAKYFATNSHSESGKVFKVDTHRLPLEQFRITKLSERENHKKDKQVIDLMSSEEEVAVFAIKGAKNIPDDAICEEWIINFLVI